MTLTRSLLGACAAALALLATTSARADIPTTFSAANCRTNMYDKYVSTNANDVNKTFLINTANKTIKNTSGATARVSCPIQLRTSGPNAGSTDGIASVVIPVQFAALTECSIETRRVPITGNSDVNKIGPVIAGSRSTVGSLTITTPSNRPVRYWNANSTQSGQPAWYYAYVSCNLAPGAQIGEYTVNQRGSSTGHTIDPMFSCPLSSDMHWRISDFLLPGLTEPTGFVMAQSADSKKVFTFTCANLPQNAWAEVAVGPAGTNPAGCNLNQASFATIKWPTSSNGGFPTEVLAQAYTPVISLPIQTNTLTCGQNTEQGDSKWFSYRIRPNGSHTGVWTASASNGNGSAGSAIDGNTGTRYTSGTDGKKNMTFTVDMGASFTGLINQVTFDSGADADDYPRLFSIMLSSDGTSFFDLAQFTANNHFATANFSIQSARFVRVRVDQDIKNGAGQNKWWSIREFNITYNGTL